MKGRPLLPPLLAAQIPGAPVGKGRPRAYLAGKSIRFYTPKKTKEWESKASDLIRFLFQGRPAIAAPVLLEVEAVSPRPQRLQRKRDPEARIIRTSKPDASNVLKSAEDALVLASVLVDDAFIVDTRCRSWYAAKGEEAHVMIRLWKVEP